MLLGVPSPEGAGRPPWDYSCCCWKYYILIYNYCCQPPCAVTSPAAAGALLFHFSCSGCSQAPGPKPIFYNNNNLALADCSPNVTNIMVSAPVGQKTYIFQMYFNNFHLSQISSILHRSARCMKHMLSRTCRFGVVQNATFSKCILNMSLVAAIWL